MEGDFNQVAAVFIQYLFTEICQGENETTLCGDNVKRRPPLYRAQCRTEMNGEVKIYSVLTLIHQHTDVLRSARLF
jgi:hypothetical protein